MMIDPHGLIHGDRIRSCSDEAQLHFPRILAASNSYGRLQMSVQRIREEVYGVFKNPPSKEQLAGWLQEYHLNFLLFVYKAQDGSLWGQWDVPKTMLGTYRLKRDHKSPEPPKEAMKQFMDRYIASRRNSVNPDDISEMFPEIPESFGNSTEIPEKSEKFQHGVVLCSEGVDVGDGVDSTPLPPKGGLRKSEQRKLATASVGMFKGPTACLTAEEREKQGREEALTFWRDLRQRDPAAYARKADGWAKKILDAEETRVA